MYYSGRRWMLYRLAVPFDHQHPQSLSLGCKVLPSVPNILSPKSEISPPSSQDPFEFLDVSSYKAVKREFSSTPDNTSRQTGTSLAANNVLVNSAGLKVESSSVTSHADMKQDTIASTDLQRAEVPKEIDGFHGFSSLKTETDLREFCGISLNAFSLLLSLLPSPTTSISSHLSPENRLLSFLLQMKTGNSFALIKNIFCMSSVVEATSNFRDILVHLKNQTQQFIVWPDKLTVRNTIPRLFREDFLDCRVIMYCLEVLLESPRQTYQLAANLQPLQSSPSTVLP
ncbi:hypothetical protein B566_EDAN010386 [Ephemera danica]|nr:hypothetical protein B566_EDAN010386 [Ephemera danica]